jgi:hypothetical protein
MNEIEVDQEVHPPTESEESPDVRIDTYSTIDDTPERPPDYAVKVKTRERTPDMAVQNFDGTFTKVNGRAVQTRRCTRPVVNFVVIFVVAFSAMMACMITLAVNGFEQPGATWLQTIAAFCLGVFVPNPQVKPET